MYRFIKFFFWVANMPTIPLVVKRVALVLSILLSVINAVGCGVPVTSQAKPQEKPKPQTDWERITTTIDKFTYPQSTLLFAPREKPNEYETKAQNRFNIKFNRTNKHYAILKTADSLEKVVAYYNKNHM